MIHCYIMSGDDYREISARLAVIETIVKDMRKSKTKDNLLAALRHLRRILNSDTNVENLENRIEVLEYTVNTLGGERDD